MKMLSEKSEKLREDLAAQVARDLGLKNCKVTLSIEVENIREKTDDDWDREYMDWMAEQVKELEGLIDATSLDLTKARKRGDYKRAAEIDKELEELFDKLEFIKTL